MNNKLTLEETKKILTLSPNQNIVILQNDICTIEQKEDGTILAGSCMKRICDDTTDESKLFECHYKFNLDTGVLNCMRIDDDGYITEHNTKFFSAHYRNELLVVEFDNEKDEPNKKIDLLIFRIYSVQGIKKLHNRVKDLEKLEVEHW